MSTQSLYIHPVTLSHTHKYRANLSRQLVNCDELRGGLCFVQGSHEVQNRATSKVPPAVLKIKVSIKQNGPWSVSCAESFVARRVRHAPPSSGRGSTIHPPHPVPKLKFLLSF